MKILHTLVLTVCASIMNSQAFAQQMTIAAASSLRPTLDYVVGAYQDLNPHHQLSIIYGASGRLTAQTINGAPFDLFMSADMEFPQRLVDEGAAASLPKVYAIGRLVLWSANADASQMTLEDLADERIRRIAIAQPTVAPYGQRAREALEVLGVWGRVENKLVFGENISQVAQMAQSGAADAGLIALSLAMQPELVNRGFYLIDADLHEPLEQGFVITRHGADNEVAETFAQFLSTPVARQLLRDNGFDVND